MKVHRLALLVVCLGVSAAAAADAPSVLVTTQMPKRGDVPDTVTAYGAANSSPAGTATLSTRRSGRVVRIAIVPGQVVEPSTPLVDVEGTPDTVAAYRQAVTGAAAAQDQRSHALRLLADRLGTRQQVEQANKALADAQATLDALKKSGGGHAVQTFKAPFGGVILAVAVTLGQDVQTGAPLVTIASKDAFVVTVGVEPADRPKLQAGQPTRLEPLIGGPPITGKLAAINATLDQRTRLVQATVSTAPDNLILGQDYRAVVTVGTLTGWLVPHDAVLTDKDGAYVFQIAREKATRVGVTIVGMRGDTTVVDAPLDPKRKLVVKGNYQLSDGAAVREQANP